MLPWFHPIQHAKQNLDRFSRFAQLTENFTMGRPFPRKSPFSMVNAAQLVSVVWRNGNSIHRTLEWLHIIQTLKMEIYASNTS